MNRTIIFSPVGGTDPISTSNLRDGSLLHICRWYKPDKVYLYMSKEILALHEKDNRYLYCLEKLAENQGKHCEYELIARPDMEDVQVFDVFYEDFKNIIQGIMKELDDSDTLLLNISSGTPAMKSVLLVLKTLGEFPCIAVQVTTPVRKMNEHIHRDYDVEMLWELDEDNGEDSENRCKEVKCPTLSLLQQEGHIKKLVSDYDYQAALEIAKMLPESATKNYIELLTMASRRLLLDFGGVDKILSHNTQYVLPIKDSSVRKYFEYALSLNIKLQRAEYADFIRAITPLLADLFERIFEKQTGRKLKDFCIQKKNKAWAWNQGKMLGTDVYKVLTEQFTEFRFGEVSSIHLCEVIKALGKDQNVKDTITALRSVESNLRNLAAHQIVSVTDVTIKEKTGYTGKQIMDMLKKSFAYAELSVKREQWESYEDMNRVIISQIENSAN